MKRASYRAGVEWIAYNDEPDDLATIAEYISTCLLADIFDVSPDRVASDVLSIRIRRDKRSAAANAELRG